MSDKQSNKQADEIARGDRVEVRLHGATLPNDAKGTVVEESPASVIPDAVLVRLDNSHQNCDNPYETSRSAVTRLDGSSADAGGEC